MGQRSGCLSITTSKSSRRFDDLYELGDGIGHGSFAAVKQCRRRHDNQAFAVKIIDKRHLKTQDLINLRDEIQILRKLQHPNIIRLIDVLDDGRRVFIVLELCHSDDLLDYLITKPQNRLTETEAAHILHALCNAVQHLHANHIIHRDLKPENILFDLHGNIKLADFGLAYYGQTSETDEDSKTGTVSSSSSDLDSKQQIVMNECCGTPHYVAPEVIAQRAYNYKCDVWSLGVILYVMLAGYQPFEGHSLRHIYSRISNARYDFKSARWDNVSDDAKELVKRLLTVDPSTRMELADISKHAW
eukprot:CAMPEP_0197081186 /NCGR_PEP_ID=MMETSP1384-20130603/214509_1 /TAXON_ID=29189 /ORGANISM="Ammonia sp." /LENGTH=301 /DNA_ID=CAMNT_0042520079 /DNA_START=97 /DNA_END=999 /DNA_ORIENTATION=+